MHLVGELIITGSELIGVNKGAEQIVIERKLEYSTSPCAVCKCNDKHNKIRSQLSKKCQADLHDKESFLLLLAVPTKEQKLIELAAIVCHCCKCTLSKQHDFVNQKNGLEEIYERFNEQHGTRHQCKMLPKFHPELNPIERGWSQMKCHIRSYSNGKLSKLVELIRAGLDPANLSLCLIRKYCRLQKAYLIAYERGEDFVTAEKWIKKRRSHRSYSPTIDDALDRLYFPIRSTGNEAAFVNTTTAIDDENDEDEENINPEEDLLGEEDLVLVLEQQSPDEEYDYDYSYNDLFFDEFDSNNCDYDEHAEE